MGFWHNEQVTEPGMFSIEGKEGYPPMSDIKGDVRSAWSAGIGPSGRARRTFESGREEEDEPAGELGDMSQNDDYMSAASERH